jgi:hypothetical protein
MESNARRDLKTRPRKCQRDGVAIAVIDIEDITKVLLA